MNVLLNDTVNLLYLENVTHNFTIEVSKRHLT